MPARASQPLPLYGGMKLTPPRTEDKNTCVFAVIANPEVLKLRGKNAVDKNVSVYQRSKCLNHELSLSYEFLKYFFLINMLLFIYFFATKHSHEFSLLVYFSGSSQFNRSPF